MPELTQIRVHYMALAANLLKSLRLLLEAPYASSEITSIQNQGSLAAHICICGTLIDL